MHNTKKGVVSARNVSETDCWEMFLRGNFQKTSPTPNEDPLPLFLLPSVSEPESNCPQLVQQ